MSRYDYSQCCPKDLNAFFKVYTNIIEPSFKPAGWKEYLVLKGQAVVKTRADYDREIAAIVRGEEKPPFGVNYWEWKAFLDLVHASKGAPEE